MAEVAKKSKSKKCSEMLKRRFGVELGPRKDPIYSLI